MLRCYLFGFLFGVYLQGISQDIRVSQIYSIPLLINPAKTGEFTGSDLRMIGLYANVYNDNIKNSFKNISIDKKIGKWNNLALGINYLKSGSPNFPMSGDYWSFSIAKALFLDKSKTQQIRAGFQTSYLQGEYDSQKGTYNRLFDVSVIKFHNEYNNYRFTKSLSYWNYSAGIIYSIISPKILFETGISAYNITNPREWDLIPQSGFRKRFRMSILTSLQYTFKTNHVLRFDHHSWKEGLYLRVYKPELDDGTEINENTFGVTYLNLTPKKSYSIGVFSREWKAIFSNLSYSITPKIAIAISYEMPIYRKYYDVSHIEASFIFYPKNTRYKKSVKLNSIVDNKFNDVNYNIFYEKNIYYVSQYSANNKSRALLQDIDKDGILDYADKCPDIFGSLYNAGCPSNEAASNIQQPILDSAEILNNNIKNIYFDFDDFKLNANAQIIADKLATFLSTNNQYSVNLLGMASVEGKFDYNVTLSRKRVVTLAAYLQSLGIDESRISTAYAGSKFATIKSANNENAWMDRKVFIHIFKENRDKTIKFLK